jgi:hypothetical protein
MAPLDGDRTPTPAIEGPGAQYEASLSPDGRWMVHTSEETGLPQVYVQPFPPSGAKYQITTTGAHDPLWSPDGRQILYLADRADGDHRLMSVDVRTESGFAVATPALVFEPIWDVGGGWAYDIAPDGRSFIVFPRPGGTARQEAPNREIRVTLNWTAIRLQTRILYSL